MFSCSQRPPIAAAELRTPDDQRVRRPAMHRFGTKTEVTFYRWRQEYGGLKGDQVKRLKELEAENARLRRAVSDLTL